MFLKNNPQGLGYPFSNHVIFCNSLLELSICDALYIFVHLQISPHLAGFIIGKKSSNKRKVSDKSGGDSNSWQMKANFQNITLWNHDNLPSQDDAFLRSFHWFAVAKAVSSCFVFVIITCCHP